jgi:hypothetical protein
MPQFSTQFVSAAEAGKIIDAQLADAEGLAARAAGETFVPAEAVEEYEAPSVVKRRGWLRRGWDGARSASEWLFGAGALILGLSFSSS